MKTVITCWSCSAEYDRQQHENCPICDTNFLDGPTNMNKWPTPPPGSRDSVFIDYEHGGKMRVIPAVLLSLFLLFASCTHYSCPTYSNTSDSAVYELSKANFTAPIEEQWDTVPYKPSVYELTGGVLFVVFVIGAINDAKDQD